MKTNKTMNRNNSRRKFSKLFLRVGAIAGLLVGIQSCALNQMRLGTPMNGRSVAVAVNPTDASKQFVASETGGLFKTTNGGAEWAKVTNAAHFFFTDILYHPNNAEIIIASTGEDFKQPTQSGIWRSTNGGGSWTFISLANSCSTPFSANALHYDASVNRFYVGTSCGLAFSDDDGLTWNFYANVPNFVDNVIIDVTTSSSKIIVSNGSEIKRSDDNGASWTTIGNFWASWTNRSLAFSPLDDQDIYVATNNGLMFTNNNGASWTNLFPHGINRPSIVEVTAVLPNSDGTRYKLYHSDGGCVLHSAEVTHSGSPSLGAWVNSTTQHCDYSDLGFALDGVTPIMLTGDGGNQVTADGGLNWTFANIKYEAMQITEVVGQLHGTGNGAADLYFGTQDNNIWASDNTGTTWTNSICCEGFFLGVSRDPLPAAETRVTGVTCGACFNFMAQRLLAGTVGFPNPSSSNGNPLFLGSGRYLINTSIPGVPTNLFQYTSDNGGMWTNRFGFTEQVRDFPKIAGPSSDLQFFDAVRMPGITPSGDEMLGIKRVINLEGSGTPVVSDITGFGSLGIFPTMFAWYKPFGVNPHRPDEIIAPDIISNTVKKTSNGGSIWVDDANLTNLVTQGGAFDYDRGPFTMITSFGYDPDCNGHILVGTREAGVMETFDGGNSWNKVPNSEKISLVSSFFFTDNNKVIISSYGTGLWKYKAKNCPSVVLRIPDFNFAEPTIKWKGAHVPIRDINNPDVCPVCGFMLLRGGKVRNVRMSRDNATIEEVEITGGKVSMMQFANNSWQETDQLPFKVTVNPDARFEGAELLEVNEKEMEFARGIYFEGNLFKGLVLSDHDVEESELPSMKPELPTLTSVSTTGYFAAGTESPKFRATNYKAEARYEVVLNGQVLSENQFVIEIESPSSFVIELPATYPPGGYTLVLREMGSNERALDVVTFNITVTEDRTKER